MIAALGIYLYKQMVAHSLRAWWRESVIVQIFSLQKGLGSVLSLSNSTRRLAIIRAKQSIKQAKRPIKWAKRIIK
jgi:hypothetical protein